MQIHTLQNNISLLSHSSRSSSLWYQRIPHEKETIWEIISWWEIRRIPYNVFALISIVLEMSFFDWLLDTSGNGSPLVMILLLLIGFLGVNLIYMFFYFIDIFLRNQEKAPIYPLRSKLFLISLCTPAILYFNFILYSVLFD